VSPDGLVAAGQRGEAFIQARFGEFNVGAQVIVIPRDLPYEWPNVAARNYIDEAVYKKLKRLRLTPSEVCDDSTFIRRACLDVTGTLPAPEEVNKFRAEKAPDKRERRQLRVADDLVAQGEHGRHDNRCPGGTAQCGEAAVALTEPPQGVQVRRPHIRHLREPALHI